MALESSDVSRGSPSPAVLSHLIRLLCTRATQCHEGTAGTRTRGCSCSHTDTTHQGRGYLEVLMCVREPPGQPNVYRLVREPDVSRAVDALELPSFSVVAGKCSFSLHTRMNVFSVFYPKRKKGTFPIDLKMCCIQNVEGCPFLIDVGQTIWLEVCRKSCRNLISYFSDNCNRGFLYIQSKSETMDFIAFPGQYINSHLSSVNLDVAHPQSPFHCDRKWICSLRQLPSGEILINIDQQFFDY